MIEWSHQRIRSIGPDVCSAQVAKLPESAARWRHSAEVLAVDVVVDTRLQPFHRKCVELIGKASVV